MQPVSAATGVPVVRVIGGEARGRRLRVPPGARPTRARVREAVFDMLGSLGGVAGACVADLFAGSGALGIEALSRGAASAVFVDSDRGAAAAVRENLSVLGPAAGRGEVVCCEVLRWLWAGGGAHLPLDLVLCDPPYAFDLWGQVLGGLGRLLGPASLVVVESSGPIEVPEGWVSIRSRPYGTSLVNLVRHRSGPSQKGPA